MKDTRSHAEQAHIYILKRDILRCKAQRRIRGCRRQGGEQEDKTGTDGLLNPQSRIGNSRGDCK